MHKELSEPSAYMEKLLHRINLNNLYEVVDTCYQNVSQFICPVLLKIKNMDLLDKENDVVKESDSPGETEERKKKHRIKYLL